MPKKSVPYAFQRNETVGPGLRRILEAMGDDAQDLAVLLESQLPDAIHRLRILIKRLRAYLWFLRPVLGQARYARSVNRLRKAAGQLSQARDLEVVQGALKKAALPDAHKKDLQSLVKVSQVVAQREASHPPSGAQTLGLLKKSATVVVRVITRTRESMERGKKKWPAPKHRIAKVFHAASKASHKVQRKNEAILVHSWRKKTKRLLYVLQLTQHLPHLDNDECLKKVDLLQEMLGEHQDTVVAENHLRRHASGLKASELAGAIRLLEKKRELLLQDAQECWDSIVQHF